MAAKEVDNVTDVDLETTSIIAQILRDILDSSSVQDQPPPNYVANQTVTQSNPEDFDQPTCSKTQQEGDATKVYSHPTGAIRKTCTVKEMLTEILDCTVIRKPSILMSSTPEMSEGSFVETTSPPPGYTLDPLDIHGTVNSNSNVSNVGVNSKMQCTVKDVLSEIMDYTVLNKINRQSIIYDLSKPGTSSRTRSEQLEQRENYRSYEVYRAIGAGIINSTNAIHDEAYLAKSSAISLRKFLPSYSAVIRLGPSAKVKPVHSSSSFIPRLPPPSYAEVEGVWEDRLSLVSSESAVFGPDPTYMICPRCRAAVVTEVQVHRSAMTHMMALFLCVCLCWPCCLLPYCLKSCNYSYHSCPNCSHFFGMYRPF